MVTEWLVPVAYVAGWLWTSYVIAMRMTESEAQTVLARRESWRSRFREPHEDDGKPLVDGEDRAMNIILGLLIGLVWPLALVVLGLSKALRSPTEVAEADRAELEALRALAREHNLPMPNEKDGTA